MNLLNRTAESAGLLRVTLAILVGICITSLNVRVSADDEAVLVSVNGEPITARDLDQAIMSMHRGGDLAESDDALIEKYFNKVINDRLLFQEARAMGLLEEPKTQSAIERSVEAEAARLYVDESYEAPTAPTEEAIREYFEDFYWKIELRRMSVRTREEAEQMAFMIREGASMDSLAREVSLDSKRLIGGKIGPLYWMHVGKDLRALVADSEVGDVIGPYPYQESFQLMRVEARHETQDSDFGDVESEIHTILSREDREEAWQAFVDSLLRESPVQFDEVLMASIDSDSANVLHGKFRTGSWRPVMWIGDHVRSEVQVRTAIARDAMQMGSAPWPEQRRSAVDRLSEELVLAHAAQEAGVFQRPEVERKRSSKTRELLIDAYLNQTIVPEIKFNSQEFEEFYQDNIEMFRGPAEVRLDLMVFDDEETAREARDLLEQGASFDFVREKMLGIQAADAAGTKWASESLFAAPVQEALSGLEIGGYSPVLPTSSRWMIMELEGRREGQVRELDQVELKIREVMFQRKFNEALDERLRVLKERSEIVRYDDHIREYFRPDDQAEETDLELPLGETAP